MNASCSSQSCGCQNQKAQFSLAHLTALACPPPELIRVAAAAGYDFASVRTIQMGLPGEPKYGLAGNPELLKETKAALSDTGIKILDIELARIDKNVDVASYLPQLETAAELGVRNVISSVWTDDRNYTIEQLAKLCEIAQKVGIFVNLEFVTWASGGTLKDVVSFIKAANQPRNCGLLVDTLHFHRSRVALEELDQIPASWFHFVHLCDAPPEIPTKKEDLIFTGREARLGPGVGGIDLAAIINRIPLVPYSLEIPNLERVNKVGYAEHARLCLVEAKQYVAAHPRKQLVAAH